MPTIAGMSSLAAGRMTKVWPRLLTRSSEASIGAAPPAPAPERRSGPSGSAWGLDTGGLELMGGRGEMSDAAEVLVRDFSAPLGSVAEGRLELPCRGASGVVIHAGSWDELYRAH